MTLEMGGMRRSEIVDYFIGIGGKDMGSGRYAGECWVVEIGEEQTNSLGSIKVTTTRVTFHCKDDLKDKMVYDFRLRFLSAGG